MSRRKTARGKRLVGSIGAVLALSMVFVAVLAPAPEAAAQGAKPSIAVTSINPGAGTVDITNYGSTDVDPNGLILCNFPAYGAIADAPVIPPGGTITVNSAAAGVALDGAQGEMGIYLTAAYTDPSQIVSYVEWGNGGHRRSPIAVQAGIWSPGFVSSGAVLNAGSTNPTSPFDWTGGGAGTAPAAASDDAAPAAELAFTGTNPVYVIIGSGSLLSGIGLVAISRRRMAAQD